MMQPGNRSSGEGVSKRALLIINRKSRSGSADTEDVVSRLNSRGIDIIEDPPGRSQTIAQQIYRHAGEIDCVILGGGDGSMNAAAEALVKTGLPLGVLPMGTANDLARTLKIPLEIGQACDVIAEGLLHPIDLGRVNGRYFFNVANIGLGVQVRSHMSSDLKQRWGILSYARGLLKAITSFRPFHADILCDGDRQRVRSIQIAVGNGRHYGGGMTIAEQASIDDCRFSLYSIEPLRLWEFLKFAPAFRAGRFDESHPVYVRQGRHIEVHTRKTMAITADGELVGRTPAKFDMVGGAVQVFVPASYLEEKQELNHAAQNQSTTGA
jgi:diacylglycerol kinase (ATP)